MAERMTSRADADVLKNAINGLSSDLERMGFDRGEIGASLAGIGLGMVQVHLSHDRAIDLINTVRDLLIADARPLS